MMTGAILRTWRTVKAHVPLIKFKKGGLARDNTPAAAAATTTTTITGKSGKPGKSVSHGPAIEDWQLPAHYRRAALDDREIDAINSGGAY